MKDKYKYEEKNDLINDINNLIGYQGYVQFSHRPINLKTDVFKDNKKVEVVDEGKGSFIYEAHFCNEEKSISIKQINDNWLVSTTPFSEIDNKKTDIQTYNSIDGDMQMAQIWKNEKDALCDGMEVKKVKKVIFAGFIGDDK